MLLGPKMKRGLLFPSRNDKTVPMSSNNFHYACRAAGVDSLITPSFLRTEFIFNSITQNGISMTQEMTGLSNMRMQQYLDMLPTWRN
jgi:hypothetical protein